MANNHFVRYEDLLTIEEYDVETDNISEEAKKKGYTIK